MIEHNRRGPPPISGPTMLETSSGPGAGRGGTWRRRMPGVFLAGTGVGWLAIWADEARTRAAAAGVDLDLREGDMRDLALEEPAALIYCPFRALLHLPTWADRRRTFERVAASLGPAGRFAWNALAFDHRIAARLDGAHQQDPVPHTIRYAVGENRIDVVRDDGAMSRLWWATKNEWLGLIDVASLELEALYGGFAGEPFTDDSNEYVFVARHKC